MSNKTIAQIEGSSHLPADATPLMQRVHAYEQIPINQLTVEQLRLLIGQGLSFPNLSEAAFAVLEREPFAQGDNYPGDLYLNVLRQLDRDQIATDYPQFFPIVERATAKLEEMEELERLEPGSQPDYPGPEVAEEIWRLSRKVSALNVPQSKRRPR
jgi:hypothetical protein